MFFTRPWHDERRHQVPPAHVTKNKNVKIKNQNIATDEQRIRGARPDCANEEFRLHENQKSKELLSTHSLAMTPIPIPVLQEIETQPQSKMDHDQRFAAQFP